MQNLNEIQSINALYKIIFRLEKENIDSTAQSSMEYYDKNYPYSFNILISQIVFSSFLSQRKEINIYFLYLKEIESKEDQILQEQNESIFYTFQTFLLNSNTNESNYLLAKLSENNLIKRDFIQRRFDFYFAHLMERNEYEKADITPFSSDISQLISGDLNINVRLSIEDFRKDDWKLHRKYIDEGNPSEISKVIRNDEIEKLQEISSQNDFDFNQKINSSPYERYTYVNQGNVSLINYAAFYGSINCFKFLLMNGTDLTSTTKFAVAGGNIEIIHLCEQNHLSYEGSCEAAIEFHRNDIFNYLYENNHTELDKDKLSVKRRVIILDKEKKRLNCLFNFAVKCINSGNFEIFSYLLNDGLNIADELVIRAIANGNIYMTKYLMKEKEHLPNEALTFAVSSQNIELINYIIESKDFDINTKDRWGKTAILIASENGYIDIIKILLKQNGVNINAKNQFKNTSLICASSNGYYDVVKLLLEQEDIDINAKNNDGKTALMRSLENKHFDIFKLLLEQEKIDINSEDCNGWTILLMATEQGNIEIVKLILEQKGIDINVKDKFGYTALIWASRENYTEIVKLLLEQKGIDINTQDECGYTALISAALEGHTDIVKLLLEQEEIDINIKNNRGQTALMAATKRGRKKIIKLLQNYK